MRRQYIDTFPITYYVDTNLFVNRLGKIHMVKLKTPRKHQQLKNMNNILCARY